MSMSIKEMAQQIGARANVPPELVEAQMLHETGNRTSRLANEDHNYGGVTAVEGMKFAGNTAFAHFDSDEEWVDYFSWLLPRFGVSGITDMWEYVHTLKANGYFTDSEDNYYNGMASFAGGSAPSQSLSFFGDLLGGSNVGYGTAFTSKEVADAESAYRALHEGYPEEPKSFLGYLADNFLDSVKHTGFGEFASSLYSRFAYGTGFTDRVTPVTQEDVEYTKAALPDDEELQKFCLLNATNTEELHYIVSKKQEELKQRKAFENWRQNRANAFEKVASYAVGAAGTLIDPLLLIPVGGELKAAQIIGRLGSIATNAGKIKSIATAAANFAFKHPKITERGLNTLVSGTKNAGVMTADLKAREAFGGQKVTTSDYALAATGAYLGTALIHAFGGLKGKVAENATREADKLETYSIGTLGDLERARNETLGEALKLHDSTFGSVANSKIYNKLEKGKRVVAMKAEDATALVKRLGGRELPKEVKAFYVPNEDYVMLLTDRIDPKEVNNVLAHEFAVHSTLKNTVLPEDYKRLMDTVGKLSEKRGNKLNAARDLSGSYDPEETLAYAIEHDMLPKDVLKKLVKAVNRGMREKYAKEGLPFTKMNNASVKELLEAQASIPRLGDYEVFLNPDGSTAFGGLRFSKESTLNPANLLNYIANPNDIKEVTQHDLPKLCRTISRWLEQGIYGQGINSVSNTQRKYTAMLWDDARGRGLGEYAEGLGMSAETYKMRMVQQLSLPFVKFANLRSKWLLLNGSDTMWRRWGNKANHYFNDLAIRRFNTKYGGATSEPLYDVPKEIDEAADIIKEFYDNAARLMKDGKNPLVDSGWQGVDFEFTRRSNQQLVHDFKGLFNEPEEARNFLIGYFHKAVTPEKFEVCRAKLQRDNIAANKKIEEKNLEIEAYNKEHPDTPKKLKPLKPTTISDAMVQKYYDDAIPEAVDNILSDTINELGQDAIGALGELKFLKKRVPIDTSLAVPLRRNGAADIQFSFDNNLRDMDLDRIWTSYINRASGEQALLQVFNNEQHLTNTLKKIQKNYDDAVKAGFINLSDAQRGFKNFENAIRELRGLPPADDMGLSHAEAAVRVLRNMTYAMRGSMMGLNQLAETSSTIAYGGMSQLFHSLPWVGKWVDNIRYGKESAEALREVVDQVFCESLEKQIWSMNPTDYAIRKAFTREDDLIGKGLIWAGDLANIAGKITSTINMLPKLTDYMMRGMRAQTIMDSIHWAAGKEFSALRNPFSESKLKAAHVSPADAIEIQKDINKYVSKNTDGTLKKLDVTKWQAESPYTFNQWYDLVQHQTERALVVSNRQGNKNLLKSRSQYTQMLFQFKDFTLRSINSQSMRALTARDLDDAMATTLSVMSNLAVWAARGGLGYLSYLGANKVLGGDNSDSEKYWDNYFNMDNLTRAALFRSTMIGSPLSFINDIAEATVGASTIRTSVNRSANKTPESVADVVSNFVKQIPSLDTLSTPMKAFVTTCEHLGNDKAMTKKDVKALINVLPLPNIIPVTTFINHMVNTSNYPDKRR